MEKNATSGAASAASQDMQQDDPFVSYFSKEEAADFETDLARSNDRGEPHFEVIEGGKGRSGPNEAEPWGDAIVIGDLSSPAASAVLASPITVLMAAHHRVLGGLWEHINGTVQLLIDAVLSQHPVNAEKHGRCIVYADSRLTGKKGKQFPFAYRLKKEISAITAVAIDVDGTSKVGPLLERLKELGLFAVVYTTHSHMAKRSEFGDRFRIVVFLAEPYLLPAGDARRDAVEQWEDRYTGFCEQLGLTEIDASGMAPSQMQHPPRRPADDADYEHYIVAGRALRWQDMPVGDATRYKKRGPRAGGSQSDRQADGAPAVLSDNFDVQEWFYDGGSEVLVESVLDALGWADHGSAGEGRAIVCPNDAAHTNYGDENDRGTWAAEAYGDDERAIIVCQHSSCRGLTTPDMIALIGRQIDDGVLGMPDEYPSFSALLCDPAFYPDEIDGKVLDFHPSYFGVVEEIKIEWLATPAKVKRAFKVVTENIHAGDDHYAALFAGVAKAGNKEKAVTRLSELMKDSHHDGNKIKTLAKRGKDLLQADKAAYAAKMCERERENGAAHAACFIEAEDFSKQKEYGVSVLESRNAEGADPAVFTNGNVLARVAKDRKTGRAEIVDLTTDALITFLTDHGNFRVMISDKTSREVACPQQIAVQMIHEWEKTRYPALEGIIPAPQFAEDGTLIVTPGYHPGSGLYYAPPVGFEIEPVPDVPTRKDVANAVDLWRDLFADFPFLDMTREKLLAGEESADFAHLMALALATPARDLMGPMAVVPAFLVSKPSPGTGATLILKVLQLILFGSTDINPPSNNDEELNKSVFADLIAGKPMKVWDNVEQVGGSVYPALLTAPEYSGRVLGQSLTKTVRNRMCVAFTGNNPTFTKELRRRVILCRIDAKMEKPELRETEVFKVKDVEAYALENRAMYYRALLILVRHWLAEGMLCPASPKTLASYEGWSRVCGGILGAAGIGGFLSNRDKVEEYTSGGGDDDPVRELVECWLASTKIGEDFHSGVSREGMLCKSSGNGNGRVGLIDIAANNDLTLPVKLARHATDAFGYDPADFGRFIAKGVGRVFEVDGEKWSITKGEKGKHGITWSLARVSG